MMFIEISARQSGKTNRLINEVFKRIIFGHNDGIIFSINSNMSLHIKEKIIKKIVEFNERKKEFEHIEIETENKNEIIFGKTDYISVINGKENMTISLPRKIEFKSFIEDNLKCVDKKKFYFFDEFDFCNVSDIDEEILDDFLDECQNSYFATTPRFIRNMEQIRDRHSGDFLVKVLRKNQFSYTSKHYSGGICSQLKFKNPNANEVFGTFVGN